MNNEVIPTEFRGIVQASSILTSLFNNQKTRASSPTSAPACNAQHGHKLAETQQKDTTYSSSTADLSLLVSRLVDRAPAPCRPRPTLSLDDELDDSFYATLTVGQLADPLPERVLSQTARTASSAAISRIGAPEATQNPAPATTYVPTPVELFPVANSAPVSLEIADLQRTIKTLTAENHSLRENNDNLTSRVASLSKELQHAVAARNNALASCSTRQMHLEAALKAAQDEAAKSAAISRKLAIRCRQLNDELALAQQKRPAAAASRPALPANARPAPPLPGGAGSWAGQSNAAKTRYQAELAALNVDIQRMMSY